MRILLIVCALVLAGCGDCPLGSGDRVEHVVTGEAGRVVDVADYASATDGCYVAVLYDSGRYSVNRYSWQWPEADSRYIVNWELRRVVE